ncbi:hypothetical protein A6R70_18155 [Agrobacterium rubi]|uniref:Uncharacterized protein n=3 Tax=Rhizobium/Agrobacterium group TaxID=227290 RepID=A0A2Z2PTE6_9HYPH|nr:hypothetical protein [Rhizobium rhizogenes]ASK45617.1 hypothetical protein [Agrobacterium radiobacter]ASK45758.1 hypothetical protein [Agrobacterium tumefaciens]ASK46207.1 hypothetical protein [Agrobacterium rubi]AYD04907.1 hypothetical protein NCHU2750_55390 [Neorhizobium sp. NCHU2750]OCJ08380.1 hypothetical protein A6U88_25060 [Agrobacterium sp. B131/95]OCJ28701.1 hypothetical protein A6U89_28095 [Agrobacterium sp. B133/95]
MRNEKNIRPAGMSQCSRLSSGKEFSFFTIRVIFNKHFPWTETTLMHAKVALATNENYCKSGAK